MANSLHVTVPLFVTRALIALGGVATAYAVSGIIDRTMLKKIDKERIDMNKYILYELGNEFMTNGIMHTSRIDDTMIDQAITDQGDRTLFKSVHEYVLRLKRESSAADAARRNINHSGGDNPLPTPSLAYIGRYNLLMHEHFKIRENNVQGNGTRRRSVSRRRTYNNRTPQ